MKNITRATIKSFIKREFKNNNLYIKTKSSFNGMIDCVQEDKDDFRRIKNINFEEKNNFGIKGLWLVGQSRDSFTGYIDNNYIGYEIYNSCGSSIIAIKKLYRK